MARLKISTAKLKTLGSGNKKRIVLSGTTLVCALGIGYVTQFGVPGQPRFEGPVQVDNITLTSSVAMPLAGQAQSDVVEAAADTTALATGQDDAAQPPAQSTVIANPDCEMSLAAEPAAGAMVNLSLEAPCHLNERVTVHHNGMMFTEVTDANGQLDLAVPVLSEKALFMASFAGGDVASAATEINSLSFYDRVVVQWKGEAGLQLHAREFDAPYFSDGHVWAADAGDLGNAARGEGGFLMRLGRENTPNALMAEVYSYPTGTSKRSGDILLTVEAEVTNNNCSQQIEAQTFELTEGEVVEVHDIVLNIPDCDTVGDFLVLKNLLEDLTIAGR